MICRSIHLKEEYAFLGNNGRDPVLNVYLPYNMTEMHRENQKRPCMVICPGGAYLFCSQTEAEPIALNFLPHGFNVFVLDYSVSPHNFPAQVTEVAAVFDYIVKNADEMNCDTEKIVLMGFSAGGHLAAHYTNAFDLPEIREHFPESMSPKASVLCYPVISAEPDFSHKRSFRELLGHEPDSGEIARFSCEKLVSKRTPPTFLWHTSLDENVPVENSLAYAQALSRFEIPFELHIYPFGRHGLSTVDLQTNNSIEPEVARNHIWLTAVNDWLKLILFKG